MEQQQKLVDIATVYVDTRLPKGERVKEIKRQLGGNMNHFMCCGVEVSVSYSVTNLTFEQCILDIVT